MAVLSHRSRAPAIEKYLAEPPSPAYEFVVRQAKRAPWWALSFSLHIAAVVMLWRVPYRSPADEAVVTGVRLNLVAERPIVLLEPAETPPEEPPDQEVDISLDLPALRAEPVVAEAETGFELSPLAFEAVADNTPAPLPSIEPPAPSPIFNIEPALGMLGREIFAPRSPQGRANAVGGRGGTTHRAEGAVKAGLVWLAKAQEPDGSWSCRRWGGSGDHDVGITGLALLAFLGAGDTQDKGPFRATVRRALVWLKANQKPNGQFTWRTFYEQGIATMAVSEAYALSGSPQVGRMAQRAIDYIVELQPEHGGFRYGGAVPRSEGDLSVTGWQILAIKSALCAGLSVPPQAVERSRVLLASTYRGNGVSAYLVGGPDASPATTAVGMLCRQFLGGSDEEVRAAGDYLLNHEKQSGGAGKGRNRLVGDLYYTYYSATAMFQMGGEHWAAWNALFREPLVNAQVQSLYDTRSRYLRGSWDPANDYWANRGGRVYSTAMALLSLEVYYRFLPVYRK